MTRATMRQVMANVATADKTKPHIVDHSTVQYTAPDGSERVRLHNTDILTFKGKSVTVNTGGWNTVTTRDRINKFGRGLVRCHTKAGVLYVNGIAAGETITFRDGKPVGIKAVERKVAAQDKMARDIKAFSKRVFTCDPFPMPGSGDCWGCLMANAKSEPDQSDSERHPMGTTCWRDHIKEGYLHGSLIVRAMRNAGRPDAGIAYYLNNGQPDKSARATIARDLRRFLRHKAGLAA